jgi:hypothetical protein
VDDGNGVPAEPQPPEQLGWRILRPPPAAGFAFGALYGAIAGAMIAWDVAVLVRFGRLLRARIAEYTDQVDHE